MKEKKSIQPVMTVAPKRWGWVIHIVSWGVLLGFPFLFSGRDQSQSIPLDKYLHFLTTFVSFILIFYINYLYLIKRFLFRKQTMKYLLTNALLIVALIVVTQFIQEHIPHLSERREPPFDPHWTEMIGFYLALGVIYSLITALSVAFKMTSGWYTIEAERKELERSRSEAELKNLKSQLNPHFLFNTLNNIYSLIAISQERAQETVHDLSRLLRYVMYESSHPEVPLERDLDFVRNYVELMRIRLPGHVELKTEISCSQPGTPIAPLLFISLIENAFKHGVSNNKPSYIHIDIHQEEKNVVCRIENSNFPKKVDQDKSGSGIGLVNLERRLALLYPGNHSFVCEQEGENYRCYLSITLNEADV